MATIFRGIVSDAYVYWNSDQADPVGVTNKTVAFATSSASPVGAATGSLTGSFPNPTVARFPQGTTFITSWSFGGGDHDYYADANWAAADMVDLEGGNQVTSILGDNINVPFFTVTGKNWTTNTNNAVQLISGALRMTMANNVVNAECWPYGNYGPNLSFPLPAYCNDLQVDITIASNLSGVVPATAGTWVIARNMLASFNGDVGALPRLVMLENLFSGNNTVYEEFGAFGGSVDSIDILPSGSNGVHSRDIRFIVRNLCEVELWSATTGDPLVKRRWVTYHNRRAYMLGLGLCFGMTTMSIQKAGWYIELRRLIVSGTRL